MAEPLEVFISHASADAEHLHALERHLTVLKRQGTIHAWHAGLVEAGHQFDAEAAAALARAHVILLLVSADYLAANWNEMERALARHARDEVRVIPIIVEACYWEDAPFGQLKPLPSDGRPVTSWPNRSEAWTNVVLGIREVLGASPRVADGGTGVSHHVGAPARPVVHQLRVPKADFTGRVDELKDLRERLGSGVIIAGLTGQGGIGKTELTLKLAQELARDYPDGQIDVDLKGASPEPLSPAQVMAHVIRAFEPEAKLPESEAELAGKYRSVLAERRVLLLFDNARDREQVEPLIPPPGCLLLVTSRQHFTLPGIYTRRLSTLGPAEAVALVLRIAPRLDQATAEELAGLCGYLPLALRVAARRLAERVTLKTAKYIERLRSAQERLAEVDAALESSLELLDPPARALWLQLGVFPGDFDAAAAAAVGDAAAEAAERLLGDLVQWDLLEYDEATERYRLHDLAREHARSRLDKAERDAAERRHGAHFLEVAGDADHRYQKGGAAVLEGLALFDREWGNIRAAQTWAVAHAERDDVAASVACDLPLGAPHCLSLRQSPHDRIRWIDAGLVAAQRLGRRKDEGRLLNNLGVAYVALGDARKAIEYYEQCRTIAREIGDRTGEGSTLGNLGNTYCARGDAPKAIEYHGQNLDIAREIGDRRGEANALGNLGNAYSALGDAPKAIEYYEQCRTIAREIGDRRGEATACWNLGREYGTLGDVTRAIELMQFYVAFERAIGHPDADKREAEVNELRARLPAQQAGGGTPPDEV